MKIDEIARRVLRGGLMILAFTALPAAAQSFERFDQVEAMPRGDGYWEKCTVMAAHQGAYDVQCEGSEDYMVYDTWVRAPGGQPPAQTAATIGPPYTRGAVVLASPTYMANNWEVCIVGKSLPNDAYEMHCGGETGYVVTSKWLRRDRNAPGAGGPGAGPTGNNAAMAPQPQQQAAPAQRGGLLGRLKSAANEAAGGLMARLRGDQPQAQPQPAQAQPMQGNPTPPRQQTSGKWQVGDLVLGAPASIPTGFMRCQVLGTPNANGYYPLNCLDSYLNTEGKKVIWEHKTWVDSKWIKAHDPSFAPDMQFANVTPPAPAVNPNAPTTADKPGSTLKMGMYQCYSGAGANMKLRFISGSTYANEQGSQGSYTKSGPNITFKTGPWAGYYGYIYDTGDVQLRTAPDKPSTMQCDPQ